MAVGNKAETRVCSYLAPCKNLLFMTQLTAFTVLLLLHGTGRRNGTYRPILPNATISQLGEKFP